MNCSGYHHLSLSYTVITTLHRWVNMIRTVRADCTAEENALKLNSAYLPSVFAASSLLRQLGKIVAQVDVS